MGITGELKRRIFTTSDQLHLCYPERSFGTLLHSRSGHQRFWEIVGSYIDGSGDEYGFLYRGALPQLRDDLTISGQAAHQGRSSADGGQLRQAAGANAAADAIQVSRRAIALRRSDLVAIGGQADIMRTW